jgi:hypothetical protein
VLKLVGKLIFELAPDRFDRGAEAIPIAESGNKTADESFLFMLMSVGSHFSPGAKK